MNSTIQPKFRSGKSQHIDADKIRNALEADVESLVLHLFPDAKRVGQSLRIGSLSGERGNSLAIDPDNGLWIDHATEEQGNILQLWQKTHGLTFVETLREAASWLGLVHGDSTCRLNIAPRTTPRKKPIPKAPIKVPTLDKGTIAELVALRVSRGLPAFVALELLHERAMFGFCDYQGHRCWGLTDPANKNAQVRPLYPEQANWEKKAKCIFNSNTEWPIGAACLEGVEFVKFCEGPPDLLAVTTATWLELSSEDFSRVGFCCMTGSTMSIAPEALPLFQGKHVQIFVHNDPPEKGKAGQKAAKRWWLQLEDYAESVSAWMSDVESKDFNDYARRNWMATTEDSEPTLPERITP